MAAKPRKKEPTLAELLSQYGRNIASDAPVVGRRIVEGVRSLAVCTKGRDVVNAS